MKNKLLSLFLFFCLLVSHRGYSQTISAYEAIIPLYDNERLLGDVKVEIENEKLLTIDKRSLINALRGNVEKETVKKFEGLKDKASPKDVPYAIKFNPEEYKLEMPLSIKLRSKEKIGLMEDYRMRYEGEALKPAPFGGAINSRLEQTWTDNPGEGNYFNGQFDSFINMNSLVLENQSFYQSNIDEKFYRGDARLVKDFERQQIRLQAGDVHPQTQGFMVSRPVGGLNVARNFSLNPYRLPFPTGSQNFVLQARSLVKYFVNGTMIKSEYLPPGNYSAKDIPLNNGLNTILIEATDDLGQKKVFVFRSAASINLLNEGESRFDLSYGTPIFDQNFKREYLHEDGNILSGFFQYGFNSGFSTSVYGQNQKDFSLLGTEVITATVLGNLGFGTAHSEFDTLSGNAYSANYQFLGSGTKWYLAHSIGLRYEHRHETFRSSFTDTLSTVQNNYAANYALPITGFLTASVGGNYGDVRDNNFSDRYGFDTTLNIRILDRHNLSLFAGRNRDENKVWNDVAYLFLTISFPDSNDFVTTYYDQKQKSSKVTYIQDNQNRLYSPKAQVILDNSERGQIGETDILLPTPIADFGGRLNANHNLAENKVFGRGSIRMNTALVFARDNGEWALGLSRPVPSSFVLFKPEDRLSDQKIALKSTSPFTEAQTGLFGEITFANLLPYQYREIQVDPTLMDDGRTLKKEKYVLFPTYRSAHFIRLEDKGAVTLKGYLQTPNGKPWALQVGQVGDKTFFTNRDGQFFIEGIEAGSHKIRLNGLENELQLTITQSDRGVKDIGTLILSEE